MGGGPDMTARYPDGTPILGCNGMPMQKPPFADLGLALQRAQGIADRSMPQRLLTLLGWLGFYGPMDYQRDSDGHFHGQYADFSNYGVGAIPAAAGIPKDLADELARAYNLLRSKNNPNTPMWDLGRSDYVNNRLAFPGVQPAGPPAVYPPPPNQDPNVMVPFPGLRPLGPPMVYPPDPTAGSDRWPVAQ
jgi:hypothetical protein